MFFGLINYLWNPNRNALSMRNFWLFALLILAILSSCSRSDETVPAPAPSVYYWKTVFQLDSVEQSFIREHNIRKMYLRFFDVDLDSHQSPVPVGTVQFANPIPKDLQIIPVVYIEHSCLNQTCDLARLIVKRVLEMADTNDIPIEELQIDCDWTTSTQHDYFELLHHIRKELSTHSHFLLSATIRLHQLAQTPPPVDYGVLMCYNTGNLRNYLTRNAILDTKDVIPFLKFLSEYDLPLCAAYPIFNWKLLFDNQRFRAILRDEDLADTTYYKQYSPQHFRVIRTHSVASPDPTSFGMMVWAGNEVKVDTVSASTILNVQELLENKRPTINRQVVIYSLNSTLINNYSYHEMDQVYRH